MNITDALLADTNSRAAVGPARPRPKSTPNISDGGAMLAALAQEAHDTSLLVAATGSIVNAVTSGRRPQLRAMMVSYLPASPMLFPGAVGSAAAAAIPTQAIQNLSAFYGLLNFARSATIGYSNKGEPGGPSGPVSMETLSEAWQAAAMQAIGVLTTIGYLNPSSALNQGGRDNSAEVRLVEMLWGVTLGRSPCVRIDGNIIIPGWIERRSHLRREIHTPATLSINGTRHAVTVRDISSSGVGLESSQDVATGDQVRIELGSGISFDGVVAWSREGRVGVKLTRPMLRPVETNQSAL